MKWEAGKYYRTRGGHKAIVSAIVPPSPDGKTSRSYPVSGYILSPYDGQWVAVDWSLEGRCLFGDIEFVDDLIAPWIDPPEVKIELADYKGSPRVLVTIGNGPTRAFDRNGVYLGDALARELYPNIRPYEPAKSDA